jgi:hypothetical protein
LKAGSKFEVEEYCQYFEHLDLLPNVPGRKSISKLQRTNRGPLSWASGARGDTDLLV